MATLKFKNITDLFGVGPLRGDGNLAIEVFRVWGGRRGDTVVLRMNHSNKIRSVDGVIWPFRHDLSGNLSPSSVVETVQLTLTDDVDDDQFFDIRIRGIV